MNKRTSLSASHLVALIVLHLTWAVASADDANTTNEAETPEPSGDVAGVQFADDFSYSAGAKYIQEDVLGLDIDHELHGNIYTFAQLPPVVRGHLKLIMTEDNTVEGPDGQPGVLRMEIAEIPQVTVISGFAYQGNEESGKITMPGWERGEVTMNDLRRAFVTFRFRAENREDPEAFGAKFRLNFQPGLENGAKSAADFGVLIATSRWRTFRRPLASAENLAAFLETVNSENPESFKLVWSQAELITSYRPGDSLLIDDLEITIE